MDAVAPVCGEGRSRECILRSEGREGVGGAGKEEWPRAVDLRAERRGGRAGGLEGKGMGQGREGRPGACLATYPCIFQQTNK